KLTALRKELLPFQSLKPTPLPDGITVRDVGPAAPATFIPKKANLGAIEPGFLTILDEKPAQIQPMPNSTGRRTALARWLTSPDHALTSRVIVNRVWQYHFGKGLVTTPSDLGKLGEPPSHPELLDWLAHRFIHGEPGAPATGGNSASATGAWSFKKL